MNGDAFPEPALNEYGERDSSIIPFEHAILDIALSAVVKRLRYATDKLDANRQIVDQLTSNVDRETLVSVRMLKNEQQELLERVAVVLECLEHTAGTLSMCFFATVCVAVVLEGLEHTAGEFSACYLGLVLCVLLWF